mgnify:FL=1|jgi:hypothetical protein
MDHTALFCLIDDFCITFEPVYHHWLKSQGQVRRIRPSKLTLSEILFIALLFPQSHMTSFKHFYQAMTTHWDKTLFRHWLSYPQISALIHQHQMALASFCVFIQQQAQPTGVYAIDSTALRVCHNLRIPRHKTFADKAARGKTSTGWFYGFKLHTLINQLGEVVALRISPGNVDDRQMVGVLVESLPRPHDDGELRLVADRGYISGALCLRLLDQGIELLTRSRSNMKPVVLGDEQAHWIRQRGRIETVFSVMKGHMGLEHSRHRSFKGFISHVLAVVTAYAFRTNKPSMSPWKA